MQEYHFVEVRRDMVNGSIRLEFFNIWGKVEYSEEIIVTKNEQIRKQIPERLISLVNSNFEEPGGFWANFYNLKILNY